MNRLYSICVITVMFLLTIKCRASVCQTNENFNQCYPMAGCFWASEYGSCETYEDWTKIGNENSCLQYKNLGSCYDRVDCFWASRTGDCEFIGDWQSADSTMNKTNLNTQESAGVKTEDQGETRPGRNNEYQPDYKRQPDRQTALDNEPEPNHEHQPDHHEPEKEETGKHVDPESGKVDDLIFFFDQQSKAPFYSICSAYTTASTCQESGEHCFWDEYACQYEYAPCQMFNTFQKCSTYNEDCMWSKTYNICFSACNKESIEMDCVENEDCVWHEETRNIHDFQCVAISNCLNLYSATDCSKNTECLWENRTYTCISLYSPCEFFNDEEGCRAQGGQGAHACAFKNGSCVPISSANDVGERNALPPYPQPNEREKEYNPHTETHNDGPNYNIPRDPYAKSDSTHSMGEYGGYGENGNEYNHKNEDHYNNQERGNNYGENRGEYGGENRGEYGGENRSEHGGYDERREGHNGYDQNTNGYGDNSEGRNKYGPDSGRPLPPSGPTKKEKQRTMIENYLSDCSMLETEDDCANVGEDCFWYTEFQKCHPMEGACNTYINETLCGNNEDCIWNPADEECLSPCSAFATKALCMEEDEDCFWQNKPLPGEEPACLPLNVPCDHLVTQFQCGLNIEACLWEEQGDGCISVYSTCDKFQAEETCGMSTVFTCEWDEDYMICGQEKVLLQKHAIVTPGVSGTENGFWNLFQADWKIIFLIVCSILVLVSGICSILYCLKLHGKMGGDLYFLNSDFNSPLILIDPEDKDVLYDVTLQEGSIKKLSDV